MYCYLEGKLDTSEQGTTEAELDKAGLFGYAHLKRKAQLFVDETKWPPGDSGLLSLGGEGRAATYTVLAAPAFWPQRQDGGRKLYLATPTQFDNGWQAANWDRYFSRAGELQAAAVRRHQLVGGWDLANNRPKPMRRYVPVGAVYTFSGRLQTEAVNQPMIYRFSVKEQPGIR